MIATKTLQQRISEQRKWIEKCEAGRSYLGPNGKMIREADKQELKRLELLASGRRPS